jgi:hypothetical protein
MNFFRTNITDDLLQWIQVKQEMGTIESYFRMMIFKENWSRWSLRRHQLYGCAMPLFGNQQFVYTEASNNELRRLTLLVPIVYVNSTRYEELQQPVLSNIRAHLDNFFNNHPSENDRIQSLLEFCDRCPISNPFRIPEMPNLLAF